MRRFTTSVVLGGAAAAASLYAGVAAADPGDPTTLVVPDPFGFSFTDPDFTYQALTPIQSIAYGNGTIDINSGELAAPVQQFFEKYVTVNGEALSANNPLMTSIDGDIVNKLQDGLGTQQQLIFDQILTTNIDSGVIGIHDFGDGYGYAYIDLVGPGFESLNSNGVDHAVGAFLVTPYGTFDVSNVENGQDYGGLAYLESQLFDFSNPPENPFGIEVTGTPDFDYQTAGVFGNTAYGTQDIQFNPENLTTFAKDFLQDNGVNLQNFGTALNDDAQANIINTLSYTGIGNGFGSQQLFLPEIDGTNIDSAAITTQVLGGGFSYDSIALDLDGSSTDAIGAWLQTPFGDIDVSPWASLAAQVFDPNYFDIGGFPMDNLIPPTFDFLF